MKSYSPPEKKKNESLLTVENTDRGPTRRMKLCSFAVLEEFELATGANWKRGVAEGHRPRWNNAAKTDAAQERTEERPTHLSL
jgi:hypothetical protein